MAVLVGMLGALRRALAAIPWQVWAGAALVIAVLVWGDWRERRARQAERAACAAVVQQWRDRVASMEAATRHALRQAEERQRRAERLYDEQRRANQARVQPVLRQLRQYRAPADGAQCAVPPEIEAATRALAERT